MSDEFKLLASRIKELREVSGCSVEEIAEELNIPVDKYLEYESGLNIPISVLYHISNKFKIDLAEILTELQPVFPPMRLFVPVRAPIPIAIRLFL